MRMKRLVKDRVPIARIARQYGVSRQSIYNILKSSSEVKSREARPSKLDPFKAYVDDRLGEFDLPATVLMHEIRELGYSGGITILKEYASQVKQNVVKGVIERFETLPGRQAQIDWGECGTIVEHGESRRLYLFVFVLGFSRMLFARFTTSTKQPTLLAVLREAFERLGVPKELLVDNMKTAVDRHALGEDVRFNRGFLDFCEHYGTLPVACPPYWPRAKGKVESGVKYVKRSFLTGRTFATLEDLNQQLDAWLDGVANVRNHGTTHERPIDRYAHEVNSLRPAAAVPRFDTRELLLRKVQSDSHVRLAGRAFSVPPHAVGRMVHVRIQRIAPGESFEIVLNGEVLTPHRIPVTASIRRVTLPEHAAQIRAAAARSRKPEKPRTTFRQAQPSDEDVAGLPVGFEAAPVVQMRSLAEYERMLEAAS
jgi:transposase